MTNLDIYFLPIVVKYFLRYILLIRIKRNLEGAGALGVQLPLKLHVSFSSTPSLLEPFFACCRLTRYFQTYRFLQQTKRSANDALRRLGHRRP